MEMAQKLCCLAILLHLPLRKNSERFKIAWSSFFCTISQALFVFSIILRPAIKKFIERSEEGQKAIGML